MAMAMANARPVLVVAVVVIVVVVVVVVVVELLWLLLMMLLLSLVSLSLLLLLPSVIIAENLAAKDSINVPHIAAGNAVSTMKNETHIILVTHNNASADSGESIAETTKGKGDPFTTAIMTLEHTN